jgi:hypothetical protein
MARAFGRARPEVAESSGFSLHAGIAAKALIGVRNGCKI